MNKTEDATTLAYIDNLLTEVKRHESQAKRSITIETKLDQMRHASYKRRLVNKLRLALFDITDGKTTIGEVIKGTE